MMDKVSRTQVEQWEEAVMPAQLQELLPMPYSYKLKKWNLLESKTSHFEAIILTNVYTEEDAQEWWHEFNAKSNTTMRVRATCPKTGKVNLFKIYLRCLHQGRADKSDNEQNKCKKSSMKRNTGCPAGMIIAIRRFVKYSRSKIRDPVDPIHPCEIQIRFVHNHPTNSADSLRFRPVSKDVEDKLLSLYQIGHSPSSALEMIKIDLQTEHGTSYAQLASDRYHCPDKSYCFRLYYKHFGKEYASAALKDLSNTLDAKVFQYNTDLGEKCMAVERSGPDLVIAVCTPLMKRAHTFQQASNMVYLESSESLGNKEKMEHHVLLLIVHTAAGGVPLGAIVTTSNSILILSLGFQLLKQLLPDQAFCGRGIKGPHEFSIEESDDQKVALHNVWPDAVIVFCIFRILQSTWQWLWDEKNNIHMDHRLYLLYLIKTVLYASSEIEMTGKYQALLVDNITAHYPKYLLQVDNLWQKRLYWGICFYQLLPLDAANNYYEAAVRAMKDKVLEQTKTFNIIQLIHFLLTRLEAFYKSKLHSILDGGINHILRSTFPCDIPESINCEIKQVAGNYFVVPSGLPDKTYTVDPELNSCTCPIGITGAFCQHQLWIFLKRPNNMFSVNFMDDELRNKIDYVVNDIKDPINLVQCTLLPLPFSIESSVQENDNLIPSASAEEEKFVMNSEFSNVHLPQNATHLETVEESHVAAGSSELTVNIPDVENYMSASSQGEKNLTVNTNMVNISDTSTSSVMSPSPSSQKKDISNLENGKWEISKARMNQATQKFEQFYQQVKEGLKTQPKLFLPAVEMMMRNIERNGNSMNLLVSGLSLFGEAAVADSLKPNQRKSATLSKLIVPKVYGRQMITYGKRRKTCNAGNNSSTQPPQSKKINLSKELHSSTRLKSFIKLNPATHKEHSTELNSSTEQHHPNVLNLSAAHHSPDLNSSSVLHHTTGLDSSSELHNPPALNSSAELHNPIDLNSSAELHNPVDLNSSAELHNSTALNSAELHSSTVLNSSTELHNSTTLNNSAEVMLEANAMALNYSMKLPHSRELSSSIELYNSAALNFSTKVQDSTELSPSTALCPPQLHLSTDLHFSTSASQCNGLNLCIGLQNDAELDSLQYIRTELTNSLISQEVNRAILISGESQPQ